MFIFMHLYLWLNKRFSSSICQLNQSFLTDFNNLHNSWSEEADKMFVQQAIFLFFLIPFITSHCISYSPSSCEPLICPDTLHLSSWRLTGCLEFLASPSDRKRNPIYLMFYSRPLPFGVYPRKQSYIGLITFYCQRAKNRVFCHFILPYKSWNILFFFFFNILMMC